LPRCGIDMSKWAVIACDQHTSEPEYWNRVQRAVTNVPSAYYMMLPEHRYRDANIDELISGTRSAMDAYLRGDVFNTVLDSYVIVERTLYNGKVRQGIVGAIDLELYDPAPHPDSTVRGTEAVVPERLPLRIRLREDATIDMPHVLLMTDERFNFTSEELQSLELLYDFELMEGGGHITGRRLPSDSTIRVPSSDLLLVGDGNHSVASAKACWERAKPTLSAEARESHPLRFALAEVVSIHDASMEFEPIHRIVFGCEPQRLLETMTREIPGGEEIGYAYNGHAGLIHVPSLGAVQTFLDAYSERGHIDYIHGDDVAVRLSRESGALSIILPAINKSGFFELVRRDGAFPRKAFSIGSARDKRYYLECRRLTL
jgi:hypothetical protein